MDPIKEKITSIIQKLFVICLALLMLVTMMPVGLYPGSDTPSAEGSFVRKLPSAEVCSKGADSDSMTRKIGYGSSVYYKFSFGELLKLDIDEIKEVTLRLAFLKGSGEKDDVVRISTLSADKMPSKPEAISLFAMGETELATVNLSSNEYEDSLFERDITEYVKGMIADGKSEFVIGIRADTNIPILMASDEHKDEAYRPCIKIVTGIAEDEDADTLKKAELKEAVYVSERNAEISGRQLADKNDFLLAGGGNETYLKFSINKKAILGRLYSARLLLDVQDSISESKIRVYCINNSEWTADSIKYNDRPRGEEEEAVSLQMSTDGITTADITQQICEAVNRGIDTITLRIVGEGNAVKLQKYGSKDYEPRLYMKATDDRSIVAASEAALNALGGNKTTFVTMNLLNSYLSSKGDTAKISWHEIDNESPDSYSANYVKTNGEVSRPKWFEENARVTVMAEIQSGDYITNRRYVLNIPAENPPNYERYEFGNYIDIGSSKSEYAQKFEYINMSGIKRNWFDGSLFTCRIPQKGSVMVLNFACSPYDVNYITLKLREGEVSSPSALYLKAFDSDAEKVRLMMPDVANTDDDGFMYLTYALPKEFTRDKRSVRLRVQFDGFEEDLSRGIYAAYMTQSSFFEPKQFYKQGEKSVSEGAFADGGIKKFIDNLRFFFTGIETDESINNDDDTPKMMIDDDIGSVVFSGKDINIAFKKNEGEKTMSVYQRSEYFDRYCISCPMTEVKGTIVADYGNFRLIENTTDDKIAVASLGSDFSGVYKDVTNEKYYTFSEDWQMTDDSVIPSDKVALDGRTLTIDANSAMLLSHISEPMQSADWRVKAINGKSVSELVFGGTQKIEDVSVKAVGGISDGAERLSVICAVYESGKLIGMGKKETELYKGINMYSVSFSDEGLYMNKSRTIKVFVSEDTENMNEISPKLELPR